MVSPPIEAANLGMADSLILMLLALVVFGPRRLPQIGRQVGKLMFELRKASNDFKFQMEDELKKADDYDRQQQEEARKRAQEAQAAALAAPAPLAAAVTPDPYADLNPPGTAEPDAEAAAPAESTQAGETGLQLQPPSTGEIVPADRPGSSAGNAVESAEAEPAAAADAAIVDTPLAAQEAKAETEASEESPIEKAAAAETQAVTEPAAHNG